MKKKICSILLAAALWKLWRKYRWEHTGSDNKL